MLEPGENCAKLCTVWRGAEALWLFHLHLLVIGCGPYLPRQISKQMWRVFQASAFWASTREAAAKCMSRMIAPAAPFRRRPCLTLHMMSKNFLQWHLEDSHGLRFVAAGRHFVSAARLAFLVDTRQPRSKAISCLHMDRDLTVY